MTKIQLFELITKNIRKYFSNNCLCNWLIISALQKRSPPRALKTHPIDGWERYRDMETLCGFAEVVYCGKELAYEDWQSFTTILEGG